MANEKPLRRATGAAEKPAGRSGEIEGATVGYNTISEETCKGCHNEDSPTNKPFNFEEMFEKIAHPMPDTE